MTPPPPGALQGGVEPNLAIVEASLQGSLDGSGALFRLVSETLRIRPAHVFDPVPAVHPSPVEPMPHRITTVSAAMLPRQPLRQRVADDPRAGKTLRDRRGVARSRTDASRRVRRRLRHAMGRGGS